MGLGYVRECVITFQAELYIEYVCIINYHYVLLLIIHIYGKKMQEEYITSMGRKNLVNHSNFTEKS